MDQDVGGRPSVQTLANFPEGTEHSHKLTWTSLEQWRKPCCPLTLPRSGQLFTSQHPALPPLPYFSHYTLCFSVLLPRPPKTTLYSHTKPTGMPSKLGCDLMFPSVMPPLSTVTLSHAVLTARHIHLCQVPKERLTFTFSSMSTFMLFLYFALSKQRNERNKTKLPPKDTQKESHCS